MISRRNWFRAMAGLTGGWVLAASRDAMNSPLQQQGEYFETLYEKKYKELDVIYNNPLLSAEDVHGFRLEGQAKISFPNQRMRMENVLEASLGQKANFVYWCPEDFPDNVSISWDYWPLEEPGLSILFFAATGRNGEDIFDPSLTPRAGEYQQYHHGDINAYHVSYFRRQPNHRHFQTCNLRKSYGFHMVSQGADPIPCVEFSKRPYRIRVVKAGPVVEFFINDLPIFIYQDDGTTFGPVWGEGKIGFRQMAPLVAEYANLRVVRIESL
jgi:hypothetical protein